MSLKLIRRAASEQQLFLEQTLLEVRGFTCERKGKRLVAFRQKRRPKR